MSNLITNFQGLQNLALWRCRQAGVNFGGAPTQGNQAQSPPVLVAGLINAGYNEFLSRTLESGIAVVKCSFPTVANAISYPLRPLPANGTTLNPAALRVLEGTYITQAGLPNGGYEYIFPLISTARFARITGSYTRRLSWFGPRVYYGTQQYGKPTLDIAPGTATANDTITLTVVPDPANSPTNLNASAGGMLSMPGDVPLFPQQFHMALVEYVVKNLASSIDMPQEVKMASDNWEKYVLEAQAFGATYGDGDPEQVSSDVYVEEYPLY